MHRGPKIEVIDRRGDDVVAGMAVRGQRARKVNPVHQSASEQRTQRIGIIRQNDFVHLGLRVAHRARNKRTAGSVHSSLVSYPLTEFLRSRYERKKHSAMC